VGVASGPGEVAASVGEAVVETVGEAAGTAGAATLGEAAVKAGPEAFGEGKCVDADDPVEPDGPPAQPATSAARIKATALGVAALIGLLRERLVG
jgi:hypothetical protein